MPGEDLPYTSCAVSLSGVQEGACGAGDADKVAPRCHVTALGATARIRGGPRVVTETGSVWAGAVDCPPAGLPARSSSRLLGAAHAAMRPAGRVARGRAGRVSRVLAGCVSRGRAGRVSRGRRWGRAGRVARVRCVSRGWRPVAMVRGHHDHGRRRRWRRCLASPLWRVRGQVEVERRERLGWRGGVGRLGREQRAATARTGLHSEPGPEHGNSPGESRHCQQQGGNGRLPDRGVVDPVPELLAPCRPLVPHDSSTSIKSSASLPTRTRRQTGQNRSGRDPSRRRVPHVPIAPGYVRGPGLITVPWTLCDRPPGLRRSGRVARLGIWRCSANAAPGCR